MARRRRSYEPVPARESFQEGGAAARRTQAALLLSIGAAVAAETHRVPDPEDLALPPLAPLAHPPPIPLARAAGRLDMSTAEYVSGFEGVISDEEPARLTHDLYETPEVDTAAALVEAGLHSRSRLVRTAAATAALDTTGPREDVVAVLEQSAGARDADVREMARTGLARARPDHPLLDRYVVGGRGPGHREEPSHTAVVSHGTWAAKSTWWRPGGSFYRYLDAQRPPLHLHSESFGWSGDYSDAARSLAADDLIDWVAAQHLERPDHLAHSHGATVANLATRRGLELGRLVLMGCPVHTDWLPDLRNVKALLDVRVKLDLVIMADRGGQRLPARFRDERKVHEERNGWFSHAATHDPDYWDEHDLFARLSSIR